mmetsp:Transcript_60969/g.163534  ORF Transcript_60969/g.163534 Transcript_60969/m.163534 type:complete len:238 (-) Transcript_60969:82-795(-)
MEPPLKAPRPEEWKVVDETGTSCLWVIAKCPRGHSYVDRNQGDCPLCTKRSITRAAFVARKAGKKGVKPKAAAAGKTGPEALPEALQPLWRCDECSGFYRAPFPSKCSACQKQTGSPAPTRRVAPEADVKATVHAIESARLLRAVYPEISEVEGAVVAALMQHQREPVRGVVVAAQIAALEMEYGAFDEGTLQNEECRGKARRVLNDLAKMVHPDKNKHPDAAKAFNILNGVRDGLL